MDLENQVGSNFVIIEKTTIWNKNFSQILKVWKKIYKFQDIIK